MQIWGWCYLKNLKKLLAPEHYWLSFTRTYQAKHIEEPVILVAEQKVLITNVDNYEFPKRGVQTKTLKVYRAVHQMLIPRMC